MKKLAEIWQGEARDDLVLVLSREKKQRHHWICKVEVLFARDRFFTVVKPATADQLAEILREEDDERP